MDRCLIIVTGCMFLALLLVPAESTMPSSYNCAYKNPCTGSNSNEYYPHDNRALFIQCWSGNCYEMPCPAGLVWYQNAQVCDWVTTNLPPKDTNQCNCIAKNNPCNIGTGGYFSCSSDSTKFGECDRSGDCNIRPCPPGQVWDGAIKPEFYGSRLFLIGHLATFVLT